MAERSRSEEQNGHRSILDELPVDRLKSELQEALSVAAERTAEAATGKISDLTDRLVDVASGGGIAGKAMAEGGKAAATGGSPLLGALKGGVMGAKDKAAELLSGGSGGGSGNGGKKNPLKATTIIESVDVGVPIDVAYNQWTQFQDFSGFMKKVERVEQKTDEKLDFKAKILWSHRTWEATILDQVPDDRIVWHSKGEKGHVDGTVTFHELAPNLTRVIVVLEYYPQGLFERVGNIWRAQGRRARVELKHFQRHVMTDVILHPDDVEGWRGEIHQGRVQDTGDEDTGEDADEEYDEDEDTGEDSGEDEYDEDEYADDDEYEDEDEAAEDEGAEDEYDEGDEDLAEDEDEEPAGEDEEEPADEYEDEEEEEPADEYEDDEYDDEADEDLPEDEADEDVPEDEDEYEDEYDEDDEDEYDDEPEADEEDEYDEGEYEDEEDLPDDEYEEEPEERPRRRAS